MAQNFRGPEINHRYLVEMVPPLCRSAQRRRAAHPATRLMDLGRGLDPYTTSSPCGGGRGSPTLVRSLNRAINKGGQLNVKSPALNANATKLVGAWRGSRMTLGLKGKRQRKSLVGRESAQLYATSFLASD